MAGKPASRFPPCGARTKSYGGRPCQAPPVIDRGTGQPRNGRCRLHGGLSTGPKTAQGKARTLAALCAGWLAWRQRKSESGS